jgi:hypothetical protein
MECFQLQRKSRRKSLTLAAVLQELSFNVSNGAKRLNGLNDLNSSSFRPIACRRTPLTPDPALALFQVFSSGLGL